MINPHRGRKETAVQPSMSLPSGHCEGRGALSGSILLGSSPLRGAALSGSIFSGSSPLQGAALSGSSLSRSSLWGVATQQCRQLQPLPPPTFTLGLTCAFTRGFCMPSEEKSHQLLGGELGSQRSRTTAAPPTAEERMSPDVTAAVPESWAWAGRREAPCNPYRLSDPNGGSF